MAPTNDYDALKSRTEENARGVYAFSRRQLDRVISPSARERAYSRAADFAQERPLLFAFLAAQFVFSFLPLVTFAIFALSVVALGLGTALIFALFWIGVALLVLVPTLFLTSSVAILVWLWAAGSFVVARRLWNMAPTGREAADGGSGEDKDNKKGIVVKGEGQ